MSVAGGSLGDLARVVEALRGAGLVVEQVLEPLGLVTGAVAADGVDALRSVPGVAAVEPQRVVRLPPEV
ncbi:hypothetical protein [Actinosynnema sp. NPDC020468]|uniref:hypothetical protein n=1 Tax=Actinosynnema sp. NPDC020468 TaxID=3154488 RepID=UPI00340BEA92